MRKHMIAVGATLLSCMFVVAALSGCGNPPQCDWNVTPVKNGVDFHSELQAQYLADDYKNISKYANGMSELSRPEAIRFEWSACPKKENVTVERYNLQISTSQKFNTNVIEYTTAEPFADVYNLCIDTGYYWRVEAELSNGKTSTSDVSSFFTAGTLPRNLYVDGITNVRDLGGWLTDTGDRVPQGLIYRCGRLNTSEQAAVNIEITEEGINTMRNDLGIRSEIDLRQPENHNHESGGITSSPLGEDVNYYLCPMEWEGVSNLLTDSRNVESIKKVFSILADKDNYPVIYHCNIGTDRTGLFAFLLNGLLGVSEEDLYRDYLFSNFGKINGSRNVSGIQNSYVKTIKSCAGNTLSEQIYHCLVDLGVPEDDLDSILDIFS